MRPLDDAARRRLLAASAVMCAFALGLAPLAARSSRELAQERAVFAARFTAPALESDAKEPPLDVKRDPFIAESAKRIGTQPDSGTIVGRHVTQGAPIAYGVPGAAPLVTAVVVGASPLALVDEGAGVRVVKAGDVVAGSRVSAIDSAGLLLQNGMRLTLSRDMP